MDVTPKVSSYPESTLKVELSILDNKTIIVIIRTL